MMRLKLNSIFLIALLVMSSIVMFPIPTVNAGCGVRGTEIYKFWSNSSILGMDYNVTDRVFTINVNGTNGTIGVFWMLVNMSSLPKTIAFDDVIINDLINYTSEVVNMTVEQTTFTFEFRNETVPAMNISLVYHHSLHVISVNWENSTDWISENIETIRFILLFVISVIIVIGVYRSWKKKKFK